MAVQEWYDGDYVCSQQRDNGGGIGREYRRHRYLKAEVAIASLQRPGGASLARLNAASWQSFFFPSEASDAEAAAEDAADLAEDLRKIEWLVLRYRQKEAVHPVVINSDGVVLDGYHRVAALNECGVAKADAYMLLD